MQAQLYCKFSYQDRLLDVVDVAAQTGVPVQMTRRRRSRHCADSNYRVLTNSRQICNQLLQLLLRLVEHRLTDGTND